MQDIQIDNESSDDKHPNIATSEPNQTSYVTEPIDFGDDDRFNNKANKFSFNNIRNYLFPDEMPLYWVGLHLILIYIYFIFSPVANKLTYEEFTSKSGIFRFRTETLLLWIYFIVNILGYILAMLFRIVFIFITANIFRIRSLIGLTISSSSDPHLSYLFWTISMYIFLQKSVVKINDKYHMEFVNVLFNTDFTFDDRLGLWIFSIQKLYIMMSVRVMMPNPVFFPL